jgi:hypothetical protein
MLAPNEAASFDVAGTGDNVEVMVFSNVTNVQVLAQIIDSQGNVVVAFRPNGDTTTVGQ